MNERTSNAMTVDSSLGPQSKNAPTDLLRIDGKLAFICALGGDRSREITVRMAACWNACAGLTSEELEQKPTKDMFLLALHAVRQRDELLKALKSCAAVCAGESTSKSSLVRALEMARTAMEKATGESE
jgi:hypothetical protein